MPSQSIYTDYAGRDGGTYSRIDAEIAGRICEPANAARILACVNALAGASNPEALPAVLDAIRDVARELEGIGERHGESLVEYGCLHALATAFKAAGLQALDPNGKWA